MTKAEKPNVDKIIITIVALLIMFSIGYVVGQNVSTDDTTENEEISHHDEDIHDDTANHSHSDMFMVGEDQAPGVNVLVNEDAKSGWNVKLVTTNFTFAPESVNTGNVVGEGHAHLYVDGEKVARLYGPDYHYDVNFDGSKEFRVTLNANDHSEYAVSGEVIEATVTVTHESHGSHAH